MEEHCLAIFCLKVHFKMIPSHHKVFTLVAGGQGGAGGGHCGDGHRDREHHQPGGVRGGDQASVQSGLDLSQERELTSCEPLES